MDTKPYIKRLMSDDVKFIIGHSPLWSFPLCNYGYTLHGTNFAALSVSFHNFGVSDLEYLKTHFKQWTIEEIEVQMALGILGCDNGEDSKRISVWERI